MGPEEPSWRKARVTDEDNPRYISRVAMQFIEVFDLSSVRIDPEHKPDWL